ncbi:MAG: hypothetical protein ABSE16_01240 [Verrucomicrobiota bacterium]|jgi:hypothetical protein
MKFRITNDELRMTNGAPPIGRRGAAFMPLRGSQARKSSVLPLAGPMLKRPEGRALRASSGRHSEGVALIITLILLSVTLLMAVAFLALSQRERNAVTTDTDAITARLAADSALSAAEAQIIANIANPTNDIIPTATNAGAWNFGLLVSTNYINANGFVSGLANPANVNFNYYANGSGPLSMNDFIQAVANLFYAPRVPVYLTNLVYHTNENRYYLDLNRNGQPDANGWVVSVDNTGKPILDSSGNEITNFAVGDPEWVGMLERPDTTHGPNNKFVSRYAFFAVPAGNTLDVNYIHNQAQRGLPTVPPPGNAAVNPGPGDSYVRNEGVGTWELNLAAFLADLNTNQWGEEVGSGGEPPMAANYYQYNTAPFGTWAEEANQGVAFNDARALLAYRYNNNFDSLSSMQDIFPLTVVPAYQGSGIDIFTYGVPMMEGFQIPVNNTFNRLYIQRAPWVGAYNTNRFFSQPSDMYDPMKTEVGVSYPGFVERLLATGSNTVATYDRYTFSRLADELGSDTTPEAGKLNVNYSNAVVTYAVPSSSGAGIFTALPSPTSFTIVPNAETNFAPWRPIDFFSAAANGMLRLYTSNWFQGLSSDYFTNYSTVTSLIYRDPSNYLATYYGLQTNYFSYIDAQGNYISNSPTGVGLTLPFLGLTNQVPAFGVTNIPVWVNGQFCYTPAVNRLLQLAANMYDATTNYYYPHVFRPLFSRDTNGYGADLFISGYVEVTNVSGPGDLRLSTPVNVWDLANQGGQILNAGVNVYGVPWIIGAKKGFPNFNEFFMESAYQLERTMLVTRTSTNALYNNNPNDFSFYPMYDMMLTNSFGMECWNSYRSNFTDSLTVYITDALTMTLTNNLGFSASTGMTNTVATPLNPNSGNYWPGYNPAGNPLMAPYSFITNFPDAFGFGAFPTNFGAIPPATYRFNTPPDAELPGYVGPYLSTDLNLPYETNIALAGFGPYPSPHWGLVMTNNVRLVMLDPSPDATGGPYHVIDYVQLGGPYSIRDLTAEIQAGYDTLVHPYYDDQWDTNVPVGHAMPTGMRNQFIVSSGQAGYIASDWGNQTEQMVYDQLNDFAAFLNGVGAADLTFQGYVPHPGQVGIYATTNQMQMPYTPSALVVQDIDWQANDPLVHYTPSDLLYTNGTGDFLQLHFPGNLGLLNQRYTPWGGNPAFGADINQYNLQVKDPLVTCSDDWNFPTNKFPTVGWLGRVHRGTPWQTVYLKSSDVIGGNGLIGTNLWVNWTSDENAYDAVNSAPKKDWLLFDLFSSTIDDDATRGQLSVNVGADNPDPLGSLAAWSALFSGVMVLSNDAPDNAVSGQTASTMTNYTAYPISPAGPAGAYSPLGQLVEGIYNIRTNFTNPDGTRGVFEHPGYLLSVPQLTVASPFLHWQNNGQNDTAQQQQGISDEMYEWLPQQVMGLVRVGTPRYVVYCYGQALKPADNSLVTSTAYFGMCTNYEVVAESAQRVVLRVDGAGTANPHVVVESATPLPPD